MTNSSDNTVTKLQASDGHTIGTYPTGMQPEGIAFDGVNVWIANNTSNSVTKLGRRRNPYRHVRRGQLSARAGFRWDQCVGDELQQRHGDRTAGDRWIASRHSNGSRQPGGHCVRRRQHVGRLPKQQYGGETGCQQWRAHRRLQRGEPALWRRLRREYIWVAGLNNVTKLQALNGSVAGSFAGLTGGLFGVAFDGANIWITNFNLNSVLKL